jgi:hypothetical protein
MQVARNFGFFNTHSSCKGQPRIIVVLDRSYVVLLSSATGNSAILSIHIFPRNRKAKFKPYKYPTYSEKTSTSPEDRIDAHAVGPSENLRWRSKYSRTDTAIEDEAHYRERTQLFVSTWGVLLTHPLLVKLEIDQIFFVKVAGWTVGHSVREI